MKTIGIIAEYNPFHNGHAYQIRRAKELTGADYCVVAMSGDFVQRGAPAVFDKYTRTRMALSAGADLVLEIPPVFATGSAEDFAACGVALLDRLGVVDALCFGSECGRIEPMMAIAEILCREPEPYRKKLAEGLKNGLTFPQARQAALAAYLAGGSTLHGEDTTAVSGIRPQGGGSQADETADGPDTGLSALLSSPNNILGIEYCKALLRRESHMEPITILRQGSGYRDTAMPEGAGASGTASGRHIPTVSGSTAASAAGAAGGIGAPAGIDSDSPAAERISRENPPTDVSPYPSAAAIRELLKSRESGGIRRHFTVLSRSVPAPVLTMIRDAYPLTPEDFSALLTQRLLTCQLAARPLTDFYDVPEDLAARIGKRTLEFAGFSDRCAALKTRQYTYTRVSRALTHIMLDMTAQDADARKAHDSVSYVRVLGFRKDAGPLLSAIAGRNAGPDGFLVDQNTEKACKKAASLPFITRTADAASLLTPDALDEFRRDLYCSHLYQSVLAAQSGRRITNEYTTAMIVV